VYDAIAAADIPGLDASKIVSGRFSVSRLPDGTSGYVLVGQGTGYDMAWRDISGIAGTITDTQHGTKTGIPFAHHGDWGHYGKIPTSAPTGAAERAYVDSANLYVHDGTSWVLRATKDWNNLINKPSTFPPSTHASTHALGGSDPVSLDASQITSGRLSLSRLPTSATANRVLLVRTANADPTYDQVDWNTDIKNKPSTFPPSAHASTHEYGGTDLVRNLDYLAVRGTTVIDSSRNLQNIASIVQSLLPNADNTYDLGSSTLRWRGLYLAGAANVGSLYVGGTVVITSDRMLSNIAYLATSLVPYLDNTYDIGGSASRIRNIYVAGTANVGSLQIAGTTVIDSSRNLVGLASVAQNLVPDTNATRNLGSSTNHFDFIYCVEIGRSDGSLGIVAYGDTYLGSGNAWRWILQSAGHLVPYADNSYDIGTSSTRVRNLYLAGAANVGSLQIAGTTVIDSSRNLTNIASATVSGAANVGYLQIGGTTVITGDRKLMNILYSATSLVPAVDATYDLGVSSQRWNNFYAVNKNAAFKHPLHNPERYIVFKCVESPKVTVEDWGIAELKDGKAFVGFSEEFVALMSDKAEYAVFLTPEGECNGLYVSKKEFYGFEVKELGNGKSNIRFSWHVKAIRIGDEETPILEEPAPTEPEKREEWTAKRRESAQKKEEDRLNRMKQKIAKYREATSQT
jgi:hypothetical protein